jgi:transcriptional regulator with XRE-family HTH domain
MRIENLEELKSYLSKIHSNKDLEKLIPKEPKMLRLVRLLKGPMNQSEFAKISGISQQYISKIENGYRKISNDILERLKIIVKDIELSEKVLVKNWQELLYKEKMNRRKGGIAMLAKKGGKKKMENLKNKLGEYKFRLLQRKIAKLGAIASLSKKKASALEETVIAAMNDIITNKETKVHHIFKGREFDIYLPSKNIYIECINRDVNIESFLEKKKIIKGKYIAFVHRKNKRYLIALWQIFDAVFLDISQLKSYIKFGDITLPKFRAKVSKNKKTKIIKNEFEKYVKKILESQNQILYEPYIKIYLGKLKLAFLRPDFITDGQEIIECTKIENLSIHTLRVHFNNLLYKAISYKKVLPSYKTVFYLSVPKTNDFLLLEHLTNHLKILNDFCDKVELVLNPQFPVP